MLSSARLARNLLFRLPDSLLLELASKYGTPYFLIDESTIAEKIDELLRAYSGYPGRVKLAYSVKANFNPRVLRVFGERDLLFDAATVEELFFIEKATGKARNSIYTSVTQTYEEFVKAISYGVNLYVVGSVRGLYNLERAAREHGKEVDILVRINPEVSYKPSTKKFYMNGKFGVPIRDPSGENAEKLVELARASSWLRFRGFHFHIGTQVTDPTRFQNAIEKIMELLASIKESARTVDIIDIGGGMPVTYDNEEPSAEEMARPIIEKLLRLADITGRVPDLVIESGRYLVAEAGVLAAKIVNVKSYSGKLYIYLDTGYHNLLDAALVKQVYPVRVVPTEGKEPPRKRIVLAGMLCDMDDVFPLGRISSLAGIDVGKLIVFGNAGAYSIVFNLPFHSQTKPPVFFRRMDGTVELARPRQSLESLYREEGGY